MNLPAKPKVVVLGMMTKMPVGGVIWQNVHYLVGLERLGCEVYYVEAHARTPSMFVAHEGEDGSEKAAAFIDRVMRRFDLGDRWAFHALHSDGRCFGLSDTGLRELYASADIIINLHGGTIPLPEHYATGRLIYLETDPVQLQIELHDERQETIEFLEPHSAFFTFGENIGNSDCRLPISDRFEFKPTRQPVVMDFWNPPGCGPGDCFTSIGNWEQQWREVWFKGERYTWSKHHEFLKILDLPSRTRQPFELALASYTDDVKQMLEGHGWRVRHALDFSADAEDYRRYVAGSRGEFTVAKDQNVRLRSGWFSDRSATYLAAGRPVITQETGFSSILPTGAGLFSFTTRDDVLTAIDAINADYGKHSRAALEIARGYFDGNVVLRRILDELAAAPPRVRVARRVRPSIPPQLLLTPVSRRPLRLPATTLNTLLALPVCEVEVEAANAAWWTASIVVVTYNGLALSKLTLIALLANTLYPNYEIIVVDNASTDGTAEWMEELAARNSHVRLILNAENRGFAAANNQGLAAARGDILILLNNDTIVPRYWLGLLLRHFMDPTIGVLGPVTNRIGNEAEIEASYETYDGFLAFAGARNGTHAGKSFDIPTPCMFCLAMRRTVYQQIGPLDERFEIGLLEDDDYAMRVRATGWRLACAEDVFVHHFGEASFGNMVPTGEYNRVLEANKQRFEDKWGTPWKPYGRKRSERDLDLVRDVRVMVEKAVPEGSTVLMVSRGDEELLKITGRTAWHFPRTPDGAYAGHHPADSADAIAQLEAGRACGAEFLVLPRLSFWWLDHYRDFKSHLETGCRLLVQSGDAGMIFYLRAPVPAAQPFSKVP